VENVKEETTLPQKIRKNMQIGWNLTDIADFAINILLTRKQKSNL
jgi:hypothetical protein